MLKFCKQCGANLAAVRGAATRTTTGGGIDWNKTWVAEMFLNQEELERQKGITPEIKRYEEIKGGVITALVGLGVMVFLNFFMAGVALKEPEDAVILNRIWVAGIIPFLVGIALIINGIFISPRIAELKRQQRRGEFEPAPPTGRLAEPPARRLVEPDPLVDFSVTEDATARMPEAPVKRDAN
jgi:hypothetical protein